MNNDSARFHPAALKALDVSIDSVCEPSEGFSQAYGARNSGSAAIQENAKFQHSA
jgi:hypothetical protein